VKTNRLTRIIAVLTVIGGIVASTSLAAYAATLTSASLGLSDARTTQTSQYTLTAGGWTTAQTIGCIEVDLGTAADGTGSIAGLSTASSTFVSQDITGTGTWAVDNTQSAAGKLRLTNGTPVVPQSGSHTAVWGAVVNGNTANTAYFAVIKTYTTNTCATAVDTTTVNLIYTDGQAASVSVDPTLTFSVTGITGNGALTVNGSTITNTLATTSTTIPFGTATTGANRIAAQSLAVTTNAGTGYTVYTRYTGQLNNGSGGTIADLSGAPNSTPILFTGAGTESFGYTTEDATLGTGTAGRFSGNKWAAFTTSNAEIAFNGAPIASDTTKVGFQVGVAGTTKAGTYNTTVIYTATPVY
jgi:hypothetical protein